ncbi:unnamed protein product [Effrenium voratum]|nr:unnamed protein product [Effrenium voratum]
MRCEPCACGGWVGAQDGTLWLAAAEEQHEFEGRKATVRKSFWDRGVLHRVAEELELSLLYEAISPRVWRVGGRAAKSVNPSLPSIAMAKTWISSAVHPGRSGARGGMPKVPMTGPQVRLLMPDDATWLLG